jgi:hypothetical protein
MYAFGYVGMYAHMYVRTHMYTFVTSGKIYLMLGVNLNSLLMHFAKFLLKGTPNFNERLSGCEQVSDFKDAIKGPSSLESNNFSLELQT